MVESLSLEEIRANDACKKDTEGVLKDRVYNWIVDRYTKHNHKFNFSDKFVWSGVAYVVPETVGYMVFFAIFLTLAMLSFKKYGDARTIVFVMLLMLWRIQIMIKYLGKINKKL